MQKLSVNRNFLKAKSKMQFGASMLEVMVALLIMSLGLLGMAGLQAATAKYRVNVESHAVVSQLVADFAERVRINPESAGPSFDPSMGSSSSLYTLTDTWSDQKEESLSISKNCENEACTSAERAEFDMVKWRLRVRDLLPQGSVLVEGNRRDGIDVALMWMDKEQTEIEEDAGTGEITRKMKLAPVCGFDSEQTIVHNCCPAAAAAPEGVRCLRMSFIP